MGLRLLGIVESLRKCFCIPIAAPKHIISNVLVHHVVIQIIQLLEVISLIIQHLNTFCRWLSYGRMSSHFKQQEEWMLGL